MVFPFFVPVDFVPVDFLPIEMYLLECNSWNMPVTNEIHFHFEGEF